MPEIARRFRIVWIVGGVLALSGILTMGVALSSPTAFEALLRFSLLWILVLVSPLLWLEFSIPWAWAAAPRVPRYIRVASRLVLPAVILAVVAVIKLKPDQFDAL